MPILNYWKKSAFLFTVSLLPFTVWHASGQDIYHIPLPFRRCCTCSGHVYNSTLSFSIYLKVPLLLTAWKLPLKTKNRLSCVCVCLNWVAVGLNVGDVPVYLWALWVSWESETLYLPKTADAQKQVQMQSTVVMPFASCVHTYFSFKCTFHPLCTFTASIVAQLILLFWCWLYLNTQHKQTFW